MLLLDQEQSVYEGCNTQADTDITLAFKISDSSQEVF